jgi:hypothetical protein
LFIFCEGEGFALDNVPSNGWVTLYFNGEYFFTARLSRFRRELLGILPNKTKKALCPAHTLKIVFPAVNMVK